MSEHEKTQSHRPASKRLLDEQASGAGKHSGRQHPPTQSVVNAKRDQSALKSAHADRKAKTGDTKY